MTDERSGDDNFLLDVRSLSQLLLKQEAELQAAQDQLQSERTRAQSVLKELEACQSGRVLLQDAINNHHNVLQGELSAEFRCHDAETKLEQREGELKDVRSALAAAQESAAQLQARSQQQAEEIDRLQQQLLSVTAESQHAIQDLHKTYTDKLLTVDSARLAVVREKESLEDRYNRDRSAWQSTIQTLQQQGSNDEAKARLQRLRQELESVRAERNQLLQMLESRQQPPQYPQQQQQQYPQQHVPGQQQQYPRQQQQQQQQRPPQYGASHGGSFQPQQRPPQQQGPWAGSGTPRGAPQSAMGAGAFGQEQPGQGRWSAGPERTGQGRRVTAALSPGLQCSPPPHGGPKGTFNELDWNGLD